SRARRWHVSGTISARFRSWVPSRPSGSSRTAPRLRPGTPGRTAEPRSSVPLVPALECEHLRQAAAVPLLLAEARARERRDDVPCELRPDHARPDAEDVHVVVLDALVRRVVIVADARADSRELVRGDADADAASAEDDPAVRLAGTDRFAHGLGDVGVVGRNARVVGAEIRDVVPGGTEVVDHHLLQRKARVIRA